MQLLLIISLDMLSLLFFVQSLHNGGQKFGVCDKANENIWFALPKFNGLLSFSIGIGMSCEGFLVLRPCRSTKMGRAMTIELSND
jgi:hypothetical protein